VLIACECCVGVVHHADVDTAAVCQFHLQSIVAGWQDGAGRVRQCRRRLDMCRREASNGRLLPLALIGFERFELIVGQSQLAYLPAVGEQSHGRTAEGTQDGSKHCEEG